MERDKRPHTKLPSFPYVNQGLFALNSLYGFLFLFLHPFPTLPYLSPSPEFSQGDRTYTKTQSRVSNCLTSGRAQTRVAGS